MSDLHSKFPTVDPAVVDDVLHQMDGDVTAAEAALLFLTATAPPAAAAPSPAAPAPSAAMVEYVLRHFPRYSRPQVLAAAAAEGPHFMDLVGLHQSFSRDVDLELKVDVAGRIVHLLKPHAAVAAATAAAAPAKREKAWRTSRASRVQHLPVSVTVAPSLPFFDDGTDAPAITLSATPVSAVPSAAPARGTAPASAATGGASGAWSTTFLPPPPKLQSFPSLHGSGPHAVAAAAAASGAVPRSKAGAGAGSAASSSAPARAAAAAGGRGRPPPVQAPTPPAATPVVSDGMELTAKQARQLQALQTKFFTIDADLVATVFAGRGFNPKACSTALTELFPDEVASAEAIASMQWDDEDGSPSAWSPGLHFPAADPRTPRTPDVVTAKLLRGGVVRLGGSVGASAGGGRGRILSVPAGAPRQRFARFDVDAGKLRADALPAPLATACECGAGSSVAADHSQRCRAAMLRACDEAAASMERRVRELLRKASEAYGRRQPSVAGQYARSAAQVRGQLGDLNTHKALLMFQRRRADAGARRAPDNNLAVDLHGLTVTPALACVQRILEHARRVRADRVTIITGRGKHSSAGPRLKPAISALLRSMGLSYAPEGPGQFVVRM